LRSHHQNDVGGRDRAIAVDISLALQTRVARVTCHRRYHDRHIRGGHLSVPIDIRRACRLRRVSGSGMQETPDQQARNQRDVNPTPKYAISSSKKWWDSFPDVRPKSSERDKMMRAALRLPPLLNWL
jgi:hypothetical protein